MPHEFGSKMPEFINLNEGQELIALAVGRRQRTKEGETVVFFDVYARGDEREMKTVQWPRFLSEPKLNEPFLLRRVSKYEYKLLLGATSDEMKTLWRDGHFGNVVAQQTAAPTGSRFPT